jgi:outer membrane receptor protein involved in Fe transport
LELDWEFFGVSQLLVTPVTAILVYYNYPFLRPHSETVLSNDPYTSTSDAGAAVAENSTSYEVIAMKLCIRLLLVVGFGLLLTAAAFGQATASGTIQGTVFDKSQAVVVGAEVVLTYKATATTRTTKTSDTGSYRFDLIAAGDYSVKVSKQGFSSVLRNVELLVGQTATANAVLQPGAPTETVEVSGVAPLVDLNKTSVSQSVTPTEVQELPLIGRDAANLAYLVPGVKAADSYDPTKSRYAVMAINGSDGRNINTTVNGIDNKDNTVGGAVMQLPLEAVQEFQISTQRFSAENGRSQGAAINMITKSGTNSYHGSVFGFFREGVLDTDQKPPDGVGGHTLAHPDYSRQFFGGAVGGPFKKDKLFAFFAIERERESQAQAVTDLAFTELSLAQQAGLAAQPSRTIPRPFYETRYNGRMDWTINNRNAAYISYSSQANDSLNDQSDSTMDLTEGNFTKNHLQVANLTLTSQLSNTMVNQFTTGYQYWNNLIDTKVAAPLVTFPNASFGTNGNVPQQSFQRKWQFKDDISKTVGKHTLKGGFDFIWNPVEGGFFKFNETLEVDFVENPSTILGDPVAFPDGFGTKGLVGSMSFSTGDPTFIVATKQLGFYFQDDWKVTPRLTLNLGLRWDKDFNTLGVSDIPNSRTYQELVAVDKICSSLVPTVCPITNPFIKKLPHNSNKDFSPRVGFAYDLTGAAKHVLRGGFGMYYGNTFQNIPLFMEQQSNPTVFQTVLSLSAPEDPVPCAGVNLGNWQFGISPSPCLPGPSALLADGSVGRVIDPNYRNPVAEEFNLGYSWAVNPSSVFEVEYTHVLSLHENKTINIDQKQPQVDPETGVLSLVRPLDDAFIAAGQPRLNSVRNEESINRSRYDGINFSYRQRMSRHFSLNANYTLAWAYGYDSGGGPDTFFRNYSRDGYHPFSPSEWGPSTTDERHHVTISSVVDLPMGLQLAPILQFGSARPYNPDSSSNTLNTGGGTVNAVVVPKDDPRNFLAFSGDDAGAQLCYYVTGQCMIAKYDPLRGDPFFQFDLRLSKNIKIREGMNLQLVGQVFNLTNRANYGNNYSLSISDPTTFGHPQGFINPSSTFIPRSLLSEFGVKLIF